MECGFVFPGKVLPSPKEAIVDPIPTSALCLVEFSCATVTKFLKEAELTLHELWKL